MKNIFIVSFFLVLLIIAIETRKTSKSRNSGSGRGSSRKYNSPQPVPPTSLSYPQPSAPKPSLFGWQEKPAQRTQNSPRQSIPSSGQGHSYPSSNTGLSGGYPQPKQPPAYQESIQRSNAPSMQSSNVPQNSPGLSGHGYPTSNGLSGNSGSGTGYPQKTDGHSYPNAAPPPYNGLPRSESHSNGLSGTGVGYPQQTGSHAYPNAGQPSYMRPESPNRNYNGANNPNTNFGQNNYQHPQGPPPPYMNSGSQYNGFSGHGSYNPGYGSQMPGYFGNVANYGRSGSGLSRTGSALTGVGIAGAGIGTVLTGLALWNLARSTGRNHHTVIYDNRGQPVAVAPDNSTAPAADSMLADLVNCSLTISTENATEVLAIPCSIATSFTPDADVKEFGENSKSNDNTKCTVTVVTKTGKEYMTTIPCSILLNTAAENNVTEPPILYNESISFNATTNVTSDQISTENQNLMLADTDKVTSNDSLKCIPEPGDTRDPINSCFAVTHNLTVIPLDPEDKNLNPGTA